MEAASKLPDAECDVFVPVTSLTGAFVEPSRPIAEIDLASGVVRIFGGIDRHALHEIIAVLKEVTQ